MVLGPHWRIAILLIMFLPGGVRAQTQSEQQTRQITLDVPVTDGLAPYRFVDVILIEQPKPSLIMKNGNTYRSATRPAKFKVLAETAQILPTQPDSPAPKKGRALVSLAISAKDEDVLREVKKLKSQNIELRPLKFMPHSEFIPFLREPEGPTAPIWSCRDKKILWENVNVPIPDGWGLFDSKDTKYIAPYGWEFPFTPFIRVCEGVKLPTSSQAKQIIPRVSTYSKKGELLVIFAGRSDDSHSNETSGIIVIKKIGSRIFVCSASQPGPASLEQVRSICSNITVDEHS